MSEASAAPAAPGSDDAGRYECGVCWWVYDPAVGDDSRGVGPGTPLGALPDDWACPSCDAARVRFLRVVESAG